MNALPVLVLEDSFLLAASLEDALLEAGHQVLLAGSIAEAQSYMHDTGFCAVAVISGADRDVVPADPAIAAHFAKPMDDRELVHWVSSITRE